MTVKRSAIAENMRNGCYERYQFVLEPLLIAIKAEYANEITVDICDEPVIVGMNAIGAQVIMHPDGNLVITIAKQGY
jgi:hypothetical protein